MTGNSPWVRPSFEVDRTEIFHNVGLLVLRVGVAIMMLFAHGAAKLVGFSEYADKFADPYGLGPTTSLVLAIFAEFFCSIAVGFGFLTRLATIPLIITMLTAALVIHANDPWTRQELPLLFFLIYLTILIAGPGKYSLDRLVFGKRDESKI